MFTLALLHCLGTSTLRLVSFRAHVGHNHALTPLASGIVNRIMYESSIARSLTCYLGTGFIRSIANLVNIHSRLEESSVRRKSEQPPFDSNGTRVAIYGALRAASLVDALYLDRLRNPDQPNQLGHLEQQAQRKRSVENEVLKELQNVLDAQLVEESRGRCP
jgi:hypothetical protein